MTNPGNITPLYIPQLPFTVGGNPALAQLLFWSVTDGTNGQTFPAGPLTQPVGANPLTITAWYFPIGGTNGGATAIIDDAFSAAIRASEDGPDQAAAADLYRRCGRLHFLLSDLAQAETASGKSLARAEQLHAAAPDIRCGQSQVGAQLPFQCDGALFGVGGASMLIEELQVHG